jgi:hypothetical protein
MRKLTQPWKLRRSFGSQPVGNVAGLRWTEAGIAAQQIPPLPSRRTYRGKVDTHCRPADLPTCRPADLPTCRPAVSGCLTSVTAPMFPPPSTPRLEISPQALPIGHACPPTAKLLSERFLLCYRAARSSSILPSPLEIARNQQIPINPDFS